VGDVTKRVVLRFFDPLFRALSPDTMGQIFDSKIFLETKLESEQRILKPKNEVSGGPVFTFSLPEEVVGTLTPVSYATAFQPYANLHGNLLQK